MVNPMGTSPKSSTISSLQSREAGNVVMQASTSPARHIRAASAFEVARITGYVSLTSDWGAGWLATLSNTRTPGRVASTMLEGVEQEHVRQHHRLQVGEDEIVQVGIDDAGRAVAECGSSTDIADRLLQRRVQHNLGIEAHLSHVVLRCGLAIRPFRPERANLRDPADRIPACRSRQYSRLLIVYSHNVFLRHVMGRSWRGTARQSAHISSNGRPECLTIKSFVNFYFYNPRFPTSNSLNHAVNFICVIVTLLHRYRPRGSFRSTRAQGAAVFRRSSGTPWRSMQAGAS